MNITGMILAGGQGRRMGGKDKGLISLNGRPLITHVIERLTPQVAEVMINANQNIEFYQRLGYPVLTDALSGFAGPLAGLERGLASASHDWVLTAPVDSPFLPFDLAKRLSQAIAASHADVAIARTFERTHPVFCLCPKRLHGSLIHYLEQGGRKIDTWLAGHHLITVAFDDQPLAFTNINTPEELKTMEQQGPIKE
ncbi:MAG: molybdenum cofactor guanylyltransferase [Proteobacteria bacterium]|nr:molybdenum cofactor guanylyltransferase [Pseudomonadota bacterium]